MVCDLYTNRLDGGWCIPTTVGKKLVPFEQPGLWDLEFGNNASAFPKKNMYFSAGPNNGKKGVVGQVNHYKCP